MCVRVCERPRLVGTEGPNYCRAHYSHVYNPTFTTVYELWNYLVRTFQQSNPAKQNLTIQKWLACMQGRTTSASEHNTTYLTLLADLQRARVESNPKQELNRFLASLDKSRFQEVVTEVSTAIKYEESTWSCGPLSQLLARQRLPFYQKTRLNQP